MKPVLEFFVKLNYYWTTSISRSSFVYQLCRWRALLRIFTWWREKNWSFQKVSPIFLDEKCYVFLNGPPPILHVLRKSRVRPKFWKKFVTIQHIWKKSNGGVLSLSFLRFFSSKSVAPIKWLPFVSREFHSRFWLVHIEMNSLTPPHKWRYFFECCQISTNFWSFWAIFVWFFR